MVPLFARVSLFLFPFVGGLMLLIIGLGLAVLAFEIWMFVDLIQNTRLTTESKVLWAVGMFLFHPFIAIIYFFVARSS